MDDPLFKLVNERKLGPYIDYIRFPFYKNIAPNTKIDFLYPITAIVGPNGTDKTSIIRALYGVPGANNLGNYWFSSGIDAIVEPGENRSCFVYGYYNTAARRDVEVLKTRIKNQDDPDYWEPSRAIKRLGMEMLPQLPKGEVAPGRSATRWDTISKKVAYLDFREILSAYDKYFYHYGPETQNKTPKQRKAFIRSRSPLLKLALRYGGDYWWYRERIVNRENAALSDDVVQAVSNIVGRSYSEIRLARHIFYNCDGYTCLVDDSDHTYSEAFAGSGEFSVIRLVSTIMSLEPHALVLLDEPEVSLHPGAQERLMDFLKTQVKLKKHQIILATHSPMMIRNLPPEAIKVLVRDPVSRKVTLLSQKAAPETAFFHLGEPQAGVRTVVVEDALAAEIVLRARRVLEESLAKMISVRFYPGGSQTLWNYYCTVFAAENRSDVLVLFDGDKRPQSLFTAASEIPASKDSDLGNLIKAVTNVDVQFKTDSGPSSEAQLVAMRRAYIDWCAKHITYLPGMGNPEEFIWGNMIKDATSSALTHGDAKSKFVQLTKLDLKLADFEIPTAKDIFETQKRHLASVPADQSDLKALVNLLRHFASSGAA